MKEYIINNNSALKSDDVELKFVEFSCDEPEHRHSGIEIVYITDGIAEHIVNGNRIRMKKGSLLIMDDDCKHSFENIEPTKYYNILLNPGFISGKHKDKSLKGLLSFCGKDISDKFIHIDMDNGYVGKLEALFFEILKEGMEKEKEYLNFIKIRVAEILNIILRKYDERNVLYEAVDSKFNKAMEYIKLNCCGELELKTVAEKFGYDPVYFSNMLKKYFGFSFKQLVIKKRLGIVLYYLWADDGSIDDIINKCGFTNKSHFYKLFEKQFGVKPKYVRAYWDNYDDIIHEKVKSRKI